MRQIGGCDFPRAEAGRSPDSDSVPPCGLRPGPREAARRAWPSVSLAGIELLDQLLAGALGALVALFGALLFLLQQARAGRALQHAPSFAVQAPQQFDQVVRRDRQGDGRTTVLGLPADVIEQAEVFANSIPSLSALAKSFSSIAIQKSPRLLRWSRTSS